MRNIYFREGKYAKFTCANIECPDLFQPYDPKCVKQYKINDCCPYNRICGNFHLKLNKLIKIFIRHKSYRGREKDRSPQVRLRGKILL